jgi:hypothetical protein
VLVVGHPRTALEDLRLRELLDDHYLRAFTDHRLLDGIDEGDPLVDAGLVTSAGRALPSVVPPPADAGLVALDAALSGPRGPDSAEHD